MSTTQELLAAKERYDRLVVRIRQFAAALAATDYRGPKPAERYIADQLAQILEKS